MVQEWQENQCWQLEWVNEGLGYPQETSTASSSLLRYPSDALSPVQRRVEQSEGHGVKMDTFGCSWVSFHIVLG